MSQLLFLPFTCAFLTVVTAELPCLLRTAAVYTRFGNSTAVFLGTLLGNAVIALLALAVANSVREHVTPGALRVLSAAFFFLLGALALKSGA